MAINVTYSNVDVPIHIPTNTVPVFAGAGLTGRDSTVYNKVHLFHSLSEAQTLFGNSGEVVNALTDFYNLDSGTSYGIIYDQALTGATLTTAQEASIDQIGEAYSTHGIRPNLASIGNMARDSTPTNTSVLFTRLKTVCASDDVKGVAVGRTANASLADANTWLTNNGGENAIGVYQDVNASGITGLDGATAFINRQAANEATNGIYSNLSNKIALGVSGVDKEISASQSATLRGNHIVSLKRGRGGFYWNGIRLSGDTDPRSYIAIKLMADTIEFEVKNLLNNYSDDRNDLELQNNVSQVLNLYLRRKQSQGWIRSSTVSFDASRGDAHNVYFNIALIFYGYAETININFKLEVS